MCVYISHSAVQGVLDIWKLNITCQLIRIEVEALLACLFGGCGLSFFGVTCARSFVGGMHGTRRERSHDLFFSTSLQAAMLSQNPIEIHARCLGWRCTTRRHRGFMVHVWAELRIYTQRRSTMRQSGRGKPEFPARGTMVPSDGTTDITMTTGIT